MKEEEGKEAEDKEEGAKAGEREGMGVEEEDETEEGREETAEE